MPKYLSFNDAFIGQPGLVRVSGMILLLLLFVAVASGCKPKSSSAGAPTTTTTTAAADTAAASTGSADTASGQANLPQVAASASGEPDMRDLNRYLLRWAIGHQRRPANFEEFAADPGVQIPPAPAGKKYTLDRTMHIVLVNQ